MAEAERELEATEVLAQFRKGTISASMRDAALGEARVRTGVQDPPRQLEEPRPQRPRDRGQGMSAGRKCGHKDLQPQAGMEWLDKENPAGVCPTCGAKEATE